MARWSTVLSGVFLALSMVLSLGKLLMLAAGNNSNNGELTEADQWLAEINLTKYRPLFKEKGRTVDFSVKIINLFSSFVRIEWSINWFEKKKETLEWWIKLPKNEVVNNDLISCFNGNDILIGLEDTSFVWHRINYDLVVLYV